MPLDPSVKTAEADVASLLGTTLNAVTLTYPIYGLTVPQANLQSTINTTAFSEQNSLGKDVYNSSDPIISNAVLAYQRWDSAYSVALSLSGYMPTWFSYGVGDERFDPTPLLGFLDKQTVRFKTERDRALVSLQAILEGNTSNSMMDVNQPSYSSPAPAFY